MIDGAGPLSKPGEQAHETQLLPGHSTKSLIHKRALMPAPATIPLFPLDLVLYPTERLPLHIFEPRYKALAAFCLKTGSPFGIIHSGDEGNLADVGCTARIARILNRYDDGRLDMLVDGESRFRIRTVHDDDLYLTADVELIEELPEDPERDLQQRVITQHMRLLELAGRTVRPSLYQNAQVLSYAIAPNAGLTPEQKQALLEILSENQRIAYLVDHLESLIPRVEQVEEVRRRIQSNGHFKDFPPEV